MAQRDGFKRNAAIFVCAVCGHNTRHTNSGNNTCCPDCYDLAGYDNTANDNGADSLSNGEWSEVQHLRAKIERKAKTPVVFHDEFPSLWNKDDTLTR